MLLRTLKPFQVLLIDSRPLQSHAIYPYLSPDSDISISETSLP